MKICTPTIPLIFSPLHVCVININYNYELEKMLLRLAKYSNINAKQQKIYDAGSGADVAGDPIAYNVQQNA